MLKSLKDNAQAVVDLGIALMIGVAFAGLMVIAYIIWAIRDMLMPDAPTVASTAAYNASYNEISLGLGNITSGFDDAVGLLIVAITIFILAIAISALMMLRAKQ